MSCQSVISRTGGKHFMSKRLVKMIPEHKIYVEAFVGGGSVYFRKPLSEVNIINDLDKDIYDIYKDITLIDNIDYIYFETKEEKEVLRERFNFYKNKNNIENPKERLYRNLYLSKMSFAGNRRNAVSDFKKIPCKIQNLKKNYQQIRNKLLNTIILNEDYKNVIEKYDSVDTFFYLDPPYSELKKSWGYEKNSIKIEEIIEVLKNIKGKFLMTYDINDKNINLFKEFFTVETIDQIYTTNNNNKKVKELIIKNY